MIRDIATFRSVRFNPVLPEECQVNPGHYGAELAFWLCTRLYSEHRIVTSYPDDDDLWWMLGYSSEDGYEFAIQCSNIYGQNDCWMISLRRYGRGFFRGGKPSFGRAGSLIAALRALLEAEEGISELEWLWEE
ncbi:hypothetical protein P12x_004593 [Tundrisphaera lichenicola]|uniref:hypothetical protein n=1 Tax=Tundrisphaera lichenicola TaxID=2029860 RepID=UPI003EB964CB